MSAALDQVFDLIWIVTHRRIGLVAVLAMAFCLPLTEVLLHAETNIVAKVREPAVAGVFYPKEKAELSRVIDTCLAAAKPEPIDGELRALVCPHAGYSYSGPVAASGYRLLVGHSYETVVVLAPSHYAVIQTAAVSNAAQYRTPLGDVPIATAKAKILAALRPFSFEAAAPVQRPDWWRQASCPEPAPGTETAQTWEHSAEVQVPFLQKTLQNFDLLPVVFGDVDPGKAAAALAQIVDEHTLIIASSDLSHYDNYANARTRDLRCVEAICGLHAEQIAPDDACGSLPIQTLIHLARARGWKARLIDYRNSGDTSGEKSRRVVGYAAIAFYAPNPDINPAAYNAEDRRFLLEIARQTLRETAASGGIPEIDSSMLAPKFRAKTGCFVTLTKRGDLRGCIGRLLAQEPLIASIVDNTRNAAIHDARFHPVTPAEADQLEIEISVLTEPLPLLFSSPLDLLNKLQPGSDGVVLQIGDRSATYLPQVWMQVPDKVKFLDSLSEKSGCAPSAWRGPGVKISIYHVESFKESDFTANGAVARQR